MAMHTFESEGTNVFYLFSFTVRCTWELPVEGKRQESNEKMKKQKRQNSSSPRCAREKDGGRLCASERA